MQLNSSNIFLLEQKRTVSSKKIKLLEYYTIGSACFQDPIAASVLSVSVDFRHIPPLAFHRHYPD